MRSSLFFWIALSAIAADAPVPPGAAAQKATPPRRSGNPRMQAEAMRNENVAVNKIDNNAVKESNVRTGTTATMITEARVETSHYAGEFGRPAEGSAVMGAPARIAGWHGELFESHQNSIFNARAFFQVGPVQPARRNHYGFRFTGNPGKDTALTVSGFQRKIRGMVNGNVLVPLANERTPLSPDPAVRALIARWLRAYPAELPNRPDFDPRALNRNAPQRIDDIDGTIRLDRNLHGLGQLSALWQISRSYTDAFQLVAGQNPINDIHAHRAQLGWRYAPSARWDIAAAASFQRAHTNLQPEPNAVGPQVRIGYQAEELGPDSEFPVDRAQNSFRYGAVIGHRSGNHSFTYGADAGRLQVNGIETYNGRGQFNFQNNFGRSGYLNLLMGTPSSYLVTIGEMARGYRTWSANAFWADRWRATPRLQIYYGIRYGLVTAPAEVNGYEKAPYSCDCINFSPRFSFAWQAPRRWVMRGSYVTSFAEIPPVTYGQMRYNLPHARSLLIQNPDVLNPLRGIDLKSGRTSPTYLNPDLVSPYAHQYNFSLERKLTGGTARFAYIGSRSFKLLNGYAFNRADPVPGIPLTLDTVDIRRADPRYYDVRYVVNAGIGYFDAAQASFDLPVYHGVRGTVTYTFSKAIDEGSDFTATAANRDVNRGRAQSQYDQLQDKKSLSNFDAPHTLLANASWDLPRVRTRGILRALFDEWQTSGIALLKNGTPLTLFIGSDAPGFGNVDGGPSDRPHLLDASLLGRTVPHPDVAPVMLSRDKFAYIRPGELRGNMGRNTLRKARIANWNAALTKQWAIAAAGREWRAQFRAEVYNLSNTPQFDEPQRNLTSPSFGKITNTLNDGRVFQFTLRLTL